MTVPMAGAPSNKATSIQAFVTFFKSLFGAGVLALPNVFGRVGLVLGIVLYSMVAFGSVISCYILLKARDIAQDIVQQEQEENNAMQEAKNDISNNAYDNLSDHQQKETKQSASPHPHLVTYGDLASVLVSPFMAFLIEWTIIVLNICFSIGIVIVMCENLRPLIPAIMTGTRAGFVLFPIIAVMLQIRWLQDMWLISAIGLVVYSIGVMGGTFYSSILSMLSASAANDGAEIVTAASSGMPTIPADLWELKWGGVTTFLGSAVYALEGINLALPTVYSMQDQSQAIPVVCWSVFLYAALTLAFAAVGYAGGLGGNPPERVCDVVLQCIAPESLQTVIRVALSAAMLLGVPIMLYPSTEMLEVMITDCSAASQQEEKPRRKNDSNIQTLQPQVSLPLWRSEQQRVANYSAVSKDDNDEEDSKAPKLPYAHQKNWKLRVLLALLIVWTGVESSSFTRFSSLVGAVGLTFVSFISPPVLYIAAMRRAGLRIDMSMKLLLGVSLLFGVFNMIVGGMQSFSNLMRGPIK